STNWFLPCDRRRLGTCINQSGCFSYSSLTFDIISGSNQRPKSKPKSVILFANPVMPFGNLRSSTNQSPKDVVSSSRLPNQPSSKTIISTPTSIQPFAMDNFFSSSKQN